MRELTNRQQQILRFIRGKQDSDGLTRTLREMASYFRLRSPNAALAHVQALLAKGALKPLPGRARSLQITGPGGRVHPGTAAGPRAVPGSQRVRLQGKRGTHSNVLRRAWLLRAEDGSRSVPIGRSKEVGSVPIYGVIPAGLPQDTTQ